MPDIWLDTDVNLPEVPVNILPLIDDTDFKAIEAAIAYNAAGMALYWHFVTTAGAYTVTAVTPTTGGNYDWTDQGDAGIYTIEIPASGGASINNDTEGFGWFTGKATGVLPWRGPVIGFRAAALNDALIDGGDLLDVNTTHIADTAQTGRDLGASVLLSSGTGTGQVSLDSGKMKLAADGLDSVTTSVTGVATTFPQMVVQLWRRFFKKADRTATTIQTYADNGTTVLTEQAISDSEGTETQGAATNPE